MVKAFQSTIDKPIESAHPPLQGYNNDSFDLQLDEENKITRLDDKESEKISNNHDVPEKQRSDDQLLRHTQNAQVDSSPDLRL